jgi:hygromycin-B 7''-O-kinase
MTWSPPSVGDAGRLPNAAPVEQWREAMVEIARRHHLPTADLLPYPTGSDVVFGGEGFVVKLTEPRWAEEFPAERFFLEHLAGKLTIAVPEVLAEGELEGWPYLVMSRLGDRAVGEVWPELDREERLRLAVRIGEMTAELHAVPPPPAREEWDAFLVERREQVVTHHRARGVSEAWLERIEPFLDETARPPRDPVLLHTELLGAHLLVAPGSEGWHPSGLIDFADAKVGHPDYEFPALVEFLFAAERGCLRRCLEGYGWREEELDREGGRRLAAWGLLHEFADLGRTLRAAGDPPPVDFGELVDRLYFLEDREVGR